MESEAGTPYGVGGGLQGPDSPRPHVFTRPLSATPMRAVCWWEKGRGTGCCETQGGRENREREDVLVPNSAPNIRAQTPWLQAPTSVRVQT